MYRTVFIIIISILVITSVLLAAKNPPMHKEIFIYDSKYEVVKNQPDYEPEKELTEKTKIIKEEQPVIKEKKTEETQVKEKPQTKSETKVNKKQENKVTKTSVKQKEQPKQTNKIEKKEVKQPVQKKQEQVTQTPVKTAPVTTVTTPTVKEQEEELIQWNKWRSDLQNRIMSDVKLPIIQEGVVFKFSFDVDKYGKVSNVQTWSENSMYTPYAIQYIAPVIRSYQGKDILNFPTGSQRFSTTVEGAWKISKTLKYSKPSDFRDSEKIKN